MTYLIIQRYEGGPRGLLQVDPITPYNRKHFIIKKVLINNDPAMHFKGPDENGDIKYTVVSKENINSSNAFYLEYYYTLELNQYDKIIEFEDDESAMLYFEVREND